MARTSVVTGEASGIGAAVVALLADAGVLGADTAAIVRVNYLGAVTGQVVFADGGGGCLRRGDDPWDHPR